MCTKGIRKWHIANAHQKKNNEKAAGHYLEVTADHSLTLPGPVDHQPQHEEGSPPWCRYMASGELNIVIGTDHLKIRSS